MSDLFEYWTIFIDRGRVPEVIFQILGAPIFYARGSVERRRTAQGWRESGSTEGFDEIGGSFRLPAGPRRDYPGPEDDAQGG
jgi:hypothetical protein